MYRSFPDAAADAANERPSVCIVTAELVGPFNNGGIGTSMTGLACRLAEAGFPVTILYTGGRWSPGVDKERWRGLYRGIGIDLVWIGDGEIDDQSGPLAECGFTMPYAVYRWLSARRFDIVQFNDCMGEGYLCLAMKRLGAAFEGTLMSLALHSPSQWVFEINRNLPDRLLHAAFNRAERLSTRCADLLWSPSLYLLEWARSRGFAFPEAVYIQQYVLPPTPMFGPRTEVPAVPAGGAAMRPREIVFFGRIEERKGVRAFCDALDRLNESLADGGLSIAFLGKPGLVGDAGALEYLAHRSSAWRFEWKIVSDFGQPEAVAYIRARAALAVIASPADNSPCTVYEALAFQMPFLAARTGGIPELIAEADHEAILFDPNGAALAERIEAAVSAGIAPARAALPQAQSRRHWIAAFEGWRALLPLLPEREPPRRLRILIDWSGMGDIAATLASIPSGEATILNRSGRSLVLRAVAILTPDDAERLVATLVADGPGAMLLVQAGARVDADGLARMTEALRLRDVDGLAPVATIDGERPRVAVPLAGGESFCLFAGAAATGGLLLKTERLLPHLAGRRLARETEYFGLADFAVAAGLEIWPFAEPVLRFAVAHASDERGLRAPERVAAYAAAGETERYYMDAIGLRAFCETPVPAPRLRALRDRLVAGRLGWTIRLATKVLPAAALARLGRRQKS